MAKFQFLALPSPNFLALALARPRRLRALIPLGGLPTIGHMGDHWHPEAWHHFAERKFANKTIIDVCYVYILCIYYVYNVCNYNFLKEKDMASSRVSEFSLHQSQWTAGFIAGSVHVQVAVSCWYRTPSRNNPRTWEERDEQQKSANTKNRPVNHPRKNMGQGQNSYLEDRYVNIADLSLRFCVTPRCSWSTVAFDPYPYHPEDHHTSSDPDTIQAPVIQIENKDGSHDHDDDDDAMMMMQ